LATTPSIHDWNDQYVTSCKLIYTVIDQAYYKLFTLPFCFQYVIIFQCAVYAVYIQYIHTHTHTYVYIYIYIYVCVWVRLTGVVLESCFCSMWSGVSDLQPVHIISMFVPKITRSYKNRQYVNKNWFCLHNLVYLKKSETAELSMGLQWPAFSRKRRAGGRGLFPFQTCLIDTYLCPKKTHLYLLTIANRYAEETHSLSFNEITEGGLIWLLLEALWWYLAVKQYLKI